MTVPSKLGQPSEVHSRSWYGNRHINAIRFAVATVIGQQKSKERRQDMKVFSSHGAPSRRRFLQAGLTTTFVGLVSSGLELATPVETLAQSQLSPDAALAELVNGNKRFTSGRLTAHEQDLAIIKQNTVDKQEPFAAVLSCADSRVPV